MKWERRKKKEPLGDVGEEVVDPKVLDVDIL